MKNAINYCADDLIGNVDIEDIQDTLEHWEDFCAVMRKRFEEAEEYLIKQQEDDGE